MAQLVENKGAKNTKRATRSARRVFNDYLKEKHESEPKTKEQICNALKLFCVEARKADGNSYCKNSLTSLKFGLCRCYKAAYGFDIINDPEFCEANKVFVPNALNSSDKGSQKSNTSHQSAKKILKDCTKTMSSTKMTQLLNYCPTLKCICNENFDIGFFAFSENLVVSDYKNTNLVEKFEREVC